MQHKRYIAIWLATFLISGSLPLGAGRLAPTRPSAITTPYPILFVTQVPTPADFTAVASVFGNHRGQIDSAPRGGDLWIRYTDGTLRNLTREAGFGMTGQQGAAAIAVREPSVHWSGTKALFSMVIGAPQRYQWNDYYWQIYEVTGLGKSEPVAITKIATQPSAYNNVSPIYGTDDRILFTSDRPRDGQRHLYPQLDEYEEAPTNTGLWSLDRVTGDLRMLNHSPSGVFTPSIDSFGRVIFTRWDHLQRDQQADSDDREGGSYGTFDYSSEASAATKLTARSEVFPEPRSSRSDLLSGTNLNGHSLNQFFPWEINEDGTSEETLNHIGRHELHGYFDRSMNDDSNLDEFIDDTSGRTNQNVLENALQMREDPTRPGVYYATDSLEFYTHASGQIVTITSEASRNADDVTVGYITARTTRETTSYDAPPSAYHSGHYRDPLPLSNGELLVVHTAETRSEDNEGTRALPDPRYDFRIKSTRTEGAYRVADAPLTAGLTASLSWWDPDVLVTWSGTLWELSPVEVRSRPRPARRETLLEEPEARIFREEGVDPVRFKSDLQSKGLAIIVSRNVTVRDKADKQQPYNLRVSGGGASTTGSAGRMYDIAHMQFFQADLLRGIGGTTDPRDGRRVLARTMHDAAVKNPVNASGPAGSVKIASDGSVAAFVPARRALAWQTTDPAGVPVVRERYWITFQPGEIRVCTSCHGANTRDQATAAPPQNSPEALRALLRYWKLDQPAGRTRPTRR